MSLSLLLLHIANRDGKIENSSCDKRDIFFDHNERAKTLPDCCTTVYPKVCGRNCTILVQQLIGNELNYHGYQALRAILMSFSNFQRQEDAFCLGLCMYDFVRLRDKTRVSVTFVDDMRRKKRTYRGNDGLFDKMIEGLQEAF